MPNVNDKRYQCNRRVVRCEKLHPDHIVNPKSVAIDRSGRLFTGSLDGNVYCLSPAGPDQAVTAVASFPNGGRPLGMRLSNDVLYFIEANSGLYSYHLQTESLKHLLSKHLGSGTIGRPKITENYSLFLQLSKTRGFWTESRRSFSTIWRWQRTRTAL